MHNESLTTCKNCEQELLGKHCHHCGQTAHVHPMNLHFVWHDIQHGLLHFDSRILRTISHLCIMPGITIRHFMKGKRVNYLNPISFYIFIATIYLLLSHFLHFDLYFLTEENGKMSANKPPEIMRIIFEDHYAYACFLILFTVPFSIGSYLVFKKQGYNFIEHFILNCFMFGIMTILFIVALLVFGVLKYNSIIHDFSVLRFIILVLYIIMPLWFYSHFFNKINPIKSLFLTILSVIVSFISLNLITYSIILIVSLITKIIHQYLLINYL